LWTDGELGGYVRYVADGQEVISIAEGLELNEGVPRNDWKLHDVLGRLANSILSGLLLVGATP